MDKVDHTEMDYRTCFSSDVGRRVLGHLLAEAGYFDDDLQTPEEIAVENYAKGILRRMGILDISNIQQVINGMINTKA